MSEETQKLTPTEENLPPWIKLRLRQDEFYYGLLTTSGTVIGISRINEVTLMPDGSYWIEVNLLVGTPPLSISNMPFLIAPSTYPTATINSSHIIAAFDLGHYHEN
ncbi:MULTISPECIES: hypothetical protein [unclassified Nostoc]|uniref:hypothetical protein n=1 Tax=unclassified Nostoc TaxID=2593658 RepID=UPI0016873AF8|nr:MULTISPECIES: hypothetical protein [unclassified Nostoc]MBD2522125.1 hypothetical protein [Nostoc sp. FACHB-133]MBN3882074.1 hypothetical protein [Nostoc sp. JL34]